MGISLSFGRKKEAPAESTAEQESPPEPALETPSADAAAAEVSEEKLTKSLPSLKLGRKEKKAKESRSKQAKSKKLPAVKKRNCFVLMIGDDGAILVHIIKGCVVRRVFAPTAEEHHIKPFFELLKAQPKHPIYMLCDMVDQSYVRHSLPPVSPLSIKKLVNRRLDRDFAPEDIKGALPLGREKEGRKEWNYLLISLANSHHLQQWMDPILQMPNRCMGLYLLPVEARVFIEHLSSASGAQEEGDASDWQILVGHDKVSGFRQTVLHKGQLIFTRLSQLSSDTPNDVMAGNIEQEVLNTIEYLRRLSFDEAQGLDVFVIVAQEVKDLLEPQKMGAKVTKLLTPYEVSKLLGLEQAALSGDRYADVVVSANFGVRQKGALKLLPGYAKKLDQIYQAALGVKAIAAIAILFVLYSSVSHLLGWQQAASAYDDAQQNKTRAQRELDDAQSRFDALGDDQTQVMRVSELYRNIKKPPNDPLDFVQRLAEVKGRGIRVIEWSWGESAEDDKAAIERKLPYTVLARLEFLGHNNDTRVLAEEVNEFMTRMRDAFPNYEVTRTPLRKEREAAAEEEKDVVIDLNQPAMEENFEMQAGDEFITIKLLGPAPEGKEGA